MMPLEILKAIELIDNKIAGLHHAKQTLLEEFGEKQGQTDNQQQTSLFTRTTRFMRSKPALLGPTRRDMIIKLLQEEGPLSRSDILEKSGIPKGTVATILNDKDRFKSKDGKWQYVERKEKDLTDSE